MNKSRIAIIILVLIAVVFAIGVGAGLSGNEDEPDAGKMNNAQIVAFVENSVPNFFKNLKESLGSQGPKLKAQDFS
jgi:flagellar basal body-associated protein FliL